MLIESNSQMAHQGQHLAAVSVERRAMNIRSDLDRKVVHCRITSVPQGILLGYPNSLLIPNIFFIQLGPVVLRMGKSIHWNEMM